MSVRCPCGADHSESAAWPLVLKFIEENGETVVVTIPVGPSGTSYRVPRAWIGMHGLKAMELSALAEKYGWERVSENASASESSPQG